MSKAVLARRSKRRTLAEPHEYERKKTKRDEGRQVHASGLHVERSLNLTKLMGIRARRHSYSWDTSYYGHTRKHSAPRVAIDRRQWRLNTTDKATMFIESMKLGSTIETAVDIAKQVFNKVESLRLDLDEGEGDKHIRLYVDSDMTGEHLLHAYDLFYERIAQEIPVEKRVYIGLSL